MNVFEYSSYKEILKAAIQENKNFRGFSTELAKAAGCQPSLISRIIHSHLHLTPDHCIGISQFLGLNDWESDYFETLLHFERAGTQRYKNRLKAKLDRMRAEAQNLSRVVNKPSIESTEAQAHYYSTWIPIAVHIACAIPGARTLNSLCAKLNLPPQVVSQALGILQDLGLVTLSKGTFVLKERFLHLPTHSPLFPTFHSNWRTRAIEDCLTRKPTSIHFTGIYAVNQDTYEEIKQLTVQNIKAMAKKAEDSKNEDEVICLSFDAFKVSG